MKTAGEKVGEVWNNQTDGPARPALKHSRSIVGGIAGLGDGLHDFGARGSLYAGMIVNHARDGHDADFRFPGDIDDRRWLANP